MVAAILSRLCCCFMCNIWWVTVREQSSHLGRTPKVFASARVWKCSKSVRECPSCCGRNRWMNKIRLPVCRTTDTGLQRIKSINEHYASMSVESNTGFFLLITVLEDCRCKVWMPPEWLVVALTVVSANRWIVKEQKKPSGARLTVLAFQFELCEWREEPQQAEHVVQFYLHRTRSRTINSTSFQCVLRVCVCVFELVHITGGLHVAS